LNKGRLPRLPAPGETLRQRVDLVVVAAGKRQQFGDKRFEPRSLVRQLLMPLSSITREAAFP
jgi:hypothetical protein